MKSPFPPPPEEKSSRMFAGIIMFWARLTLILARAVVRELKWAVSSAQNLFMPKNSNCIIIIIT